MQQLSNIHLAQKLAKSMTKNGRMSAKDKDRLCQKLGIDTSKAVFTYKVGTTTHLQRK